MPDQSLENSVREFFDAYLVAFDAIDGARIAQLYHAPTVTMRADESVHCLQSRDELRQFFQRVADTYYAEGYRSGRYRVVQTIPIGGRSALVTLDWELLRADHSVIRAWRQSYNLIRHDGGWQIVVSTFHVS
jgi:ketosteroid isomerase-like protein